MSRALALVLSLSLVLGLAGCQPLTIRDEADGRYLALVGGQVVLRRDLTVPADAARVFLQRGAVVAKRDLDLYRPSCSFQVREVRESEQVIQADRFRITRAGYGLDESVQRGPVRVAAALGGGVHGGFLANEDGGAAMVMYVIEIQLASERQPNVLHLTCRSIMDDISRVEKLSLQDLQAAVGDLVDFELP